MGRAEVPVIYLSTVNFHWMRMAHLELVLRGVRFMPTKQKKGRKPSVKVAKIAVLDKSAKRFDWYSAAFKSVSVTAKRADSNEPSRRSESGLRAKV